MNVKLAAQTLSRSVSKGLNFLKKLNNIEFADSDATAEFCLNINNGFDILNVRSKFSNIQFRKPLNERTYEELHGEAQRIIKYIINLKDQKGLCVYTSKRKTGFIGFIINLTNIFELYSQIKKHNMDYLLTFKLSQDFLETFFGAIRSRGGFNNNPNVIQFKSAYKRLLIKNEIKNFENGNVLSDSIEILNISSVSKSAERENDDFFNTEPVIDEEVMDHDYVKKIFDLTPYVGNVVEYISGYVANKLFKKISCDNCKLLLINNDTGDVPKLIALRNLGALINPSRDVIKICIKTESVIKEFKNNLHEKNLKEKIKFNVINNLPNIYSLFQSVQSDVLFLEQDILQSHKLLLIKSIVELYIKIRLHYEANKMSQKEENLRHKLHKLILFRNE